MQLFCIKNALPVRWKLPAELFLKGEMLSREWKGEEEWDHTIICVEHHEYSLHVQFGFLTPHRLGAMKCLVSTELV